MNLFYAKVALYAYPNLLAVAKQIDDLVFKKAFASMSDFSSAEKQCEKIMALTEQKDVIFELKLTLDEIFKKFSVEDLDLLDYKYFRKKPKKYFEGIDTSSRKYFRRQISICNRFALLLEKKGYDDKRFQKELFKIEFFRELLKRVVEHEKLCRKNKTQKEKMKNGIRVCEQNAKVKTA